MKYITSLGTFSIDQTTKISAISTYICTKQKTSNKLMMSRWFNSWPFDSLGWRSFKPVPKASRFHHPKKVTNCRIARNWWTESPWKSKTKPRTVFGMIHIKDSPLPRGKVWYLDFLRHHDVRFVVFFSLARSSWRSNHIFGSSALVTLPSQPMWFSTWYPGTQRRFQQKSKTKIIRTYEIHRRNDGLVILLVDEIKRCIEICKSLAKLW